MADLQSWFEYDFDKVFEAGRNAHGAEQTPDMVQKVAEAEAYQAVSGIAVTA